MHIVIISGLSGSGKSIALNMLEDAAYYCVYNLPSQLLQALVEMCIRDSRYILHRDTRIRRKTTEACGGLAQGSAQSVFRQTDPVDVYKRQPSNHLFRCLTRTI